MNSISELSLYASGNAEATECSKPTQVAPKAAWANMETNASASGGFSRLLQACMVTELYLYISIKLVQVLGK